ncbi:MAG: hypothetical protein WA063_06150 [Minisyncoccia bacterium]
MKELSDILRGKWNERFGLSFANDYREEKKITFSGNENVFRVIYSEHLEEYQRHPTRKQYELPDCFMCEGHDENYVFEEVAKIDHLRIWFSIKYATPCHYLIYDPEDHREKITEKDIVVLNELAKETGLSIFGNLRDSGASFPRHIHFQSLEVVFPLAGSPVKDSLKMNGIEIAKLDYPVSAFRLSSIEDSGIKVIARAISKLTMPYNPLFYGRDIFLVPRTRSVPSNANGFKFAAAEVAGIIFARSRKIYDLFDQKIMTDALNEVCLPQEKKNAKKFENRLIESISEEELK